MYIRAYTGFGDPPPAPVETPLVKRRPPYLVFSRIGAFALNKYALTAEVKQQITRLAGTIRARLNTADAIGVVRLVGHTDWIGTDEVNVKLGKLRAEAVRDELHAQLRDVLNRVLIYADDPSPGKTQPTADNRTPAGRAANRRVDVYIEPPIPPAPPWPQGKQEQIIDWKVRRDPNPDKDPYRITRGIPDPLGGKSVRQFLMDVCEGKFSKGKCKTLVDGAISLGCKGLEALFTQIGGTLNGAQKEALKERCQKEAGG